MIYGEPSNGGEKTKVITIGVSGLEILLDFEVLFAIDEAGVCPILFFHSCLVGLCIR